MTHTLTLHGGPRDGDTITIPTLTPGATTAILHPNPPYPGDDTHHPPHQRHRTLYAHLHPTHTHLTHIRDGTLTDLALDVR